MESFLNQLIENDDQLFRVYQSSLYHQLNDWHEHREIELIYIIEGTGTLLIGEKLEQITSNTLIMIGGNTPHLFKFDSFYYYFPRQKQGKVLIPLQLLTLHFNPDALGKTFMLRPENNQINKLFEEAERGFYIREDMKNSTLQYMHKLLDAPSYEYIPLLIQLFTGIATSDEKSFISDKSHKKDFNLIDEKRLTKIYLYTLQNFTRTIKLKEVADIVYMVPNAFCRYFKLRTNRSYFEFLMDVRIRHACKLLKETDFSVVLVCDDSGFSNLSNFNRYFKLITGKTPLEYRKASYR